MVTKDEAVGTINGDIFHHCSLTNADDTPMRVRVSGQCKTWKRNNNFRLPVKHGMFMSTAITQDNANDWEKA